MSGLGGRNYGWEWALDDFDGRINHSLLALHSGKNLRSSDVPRVAVDIGCGTGRRAASLAKLGVFDKIIASDICDRSKDVLSKNRFRLASHLITGRPNAPIHFLQANALDLRPSHFEGSRVAFINFRNVAHFLAPRDLREALANICSLASAGALIAMSFDYFRGSRLVSDKGLSVFDASDAAKFYENNRRAEINDGMPYGKYKKDGVVSYMESLGFEILTTKIGGRASEFRLVALAPEASPQAAQSVGTHRPNRMEGIAPTGLDSATMANPHERQKTREIVASHVGCG